MRQPPTWTTKDVLTSRPEKNALALDVPYGFYAELERSHAGRVELVATLLLTNYECAFRCVMCDLWKNTLDAPTPVGAIESQVAAALEQLPPARHIKLYNSGNFFDPKSIPLPDRAGVAALVGDFETVIVECHPNFCGPACREFASLLQGELEVAIGLETVHEPTLKWLNKKMTLASFDRACAMLGEADIATRAFVLLRPPGMDNDEGVEWALRSVAHAFAQGVRCVSIVPVRAGNGAMEQLQASGFFAPPSLRVIEQTMDAAMESVGPGRRVFMDLWDLEQFSECAHCVGARRQRLQASNEQQVRLPAVECDQCG